MKKQIKYCFARDKTTNLRGILVQHSDGVPRFHNLLDNGDLEKVHYWYWSAWPIADSLEYYTKKQAFVTKLQSKRYAELMDLIADLDNEKADPWPNESEIEFIYMESLDDEAYYAKR